jgi:chromosomal replication initiation ATPase DnaA
VNALHDHVLREASEVLEAELGRPRHLLWFRDVAVEEMTEAEVVLGVPTEVHRTWLAYTYGDVLRRAFARAMGEGVVVTLRVSERLEAKRRIRDRLPEDERGWDALLAERRPRPSFAGYVHDDEPQRFVLRLLQTVVHGNFDPASVYLYGDSCSGKTHLLEALRAAVEAAAPGSCALLSGRQFAARYVAALRTRDRDAVRGFEEGLLARRVVLVDGIDDLEGKPATQHVLETLMGRADGRGIRFVLSARRPPRELAGVSERLCSRLLGGLVHRLSPPTRERLERILATRAAESGAPALSPEVARSILARAPEPLAAIEILDRYPAVSWREGKALGPEWLDEVAPPARGRGARGGIVARAKDLVAEHYGVRRGSLDRSTRAPDEALPRRVAVYLVFRAAALPLSQVGKAFGLRSHSSVSRAIHAVRAQRQTDPGFEATLDGLLARL